MRILQNQHSKILGKRKRVRRKFSKEIKVEIFRLLVLGKKVKDLEKLYKIKKNTIYGWHSYFRNQVKNRKELTDRNLSQILKVRKQTVKYWRIKYVI